MALKQEINGSQAVKYSGSFLGFKRSKEDGTIDLLDENYKVAGVKITYRRKAK